MTPNGKFLREVRSLRAEHFFTESFPLNAGDNLENLETHKRKKLHAFVFLSDFFEKVKTALQDNSLKKLMKYEWNPNTGQGALPA